MKIYIPVLIVALAALTCNLPGEASGVVSTQTVSSSPPMGETFPVLTETDACKLFDEAGAASILGEAVIPPAPANAPGYSVCTFFTSSGKGIYISITMGDQAKRNLLNEISQYQKGCSVGYSGGTNTATPFPPEIEAMMSQSVPDLYQMDIQLQEQCGGKVESLPEFGPNAYAQSGQGMFQIGSVVIVSGDNLYSFGYADPALDMVGMVEKAKEITRAVISPAPAGGATPIGSPTLIGGPTPVSSATLAGGPTLLPTQVGPTWVGPTLPPTQVGPTWVGPTQVPTAVGKPPKVDDPTLVPTFVGPTPIGPTPVP